MSLSYLIANRLGGGTFAIGAVIWRANAKLIPAISGSRYLLCVEKNEPRKAELAIDIAPAA